MDDFRSRALALATRIEIDSSAAVEQELEDLRALWRGLDGHARAAAADAAQALAAAQAGRDEREAQLALKGLDRIAVDAPPQQACTASRTSGTRSSAPVSATPCRPRSTAATASW